MTAVSQTLLQKYNVAGPRYTSYPTAPMWTEAYGPAAHAETLRHTNQPAGSNHHPLSLYVHLPFCEARCLFCGCNVVITRQREQAEKYLDYLFREIAMQAALLDTTRPVVQFHWGGGTPTYLSEDQMRRLFEYQLRYFTLAPEAEVAIEVDPRHTTDGQIRLLKELGFNRISLGVQDFNPTVQEAVHRIQPFEMTAHTTALCRELGFEGLNFDLIYGLPHQTEESFTRTVAQVIELSPDRIALYSYAHVPWISPHQTAIDEATLPETAVKFRILQTALERLTAAGYRYIGMDHFAKPDDELSLALDGGKLHRNFMGYTVQQGALASDLIGFGVSAISALQGAFAQNQRKLSRYYEALDAGELPVMRGYRLSDEDKLRQAVIMAILCQGRVDYAALRAGFGIDFRGHFAEPLAALADLANDGLVLLHEDSLEVTPLGRMFSRNVAMPFDAYLKQAEGDKPTFSKTV